MISCEKDTNENPDPKAAAVPFEKKYLNASELPSDIQYYITTNDTKKTAKSENTSENLSDAIFIAHDIISMTDEKNITNYSISFYYPDTPENVFYNLIINVLPTGESAKYIYKYICNPADLANFKAHHYDFRYFVGMTEISMPTDNGSRTFTSRSTSDDDPRPKIFVPSKTDWPNNGDGTAAGGSTGGTNTGGSGYNTSVPGYNTPGHTGGTSPGPSTGGSGGHDHSGCYGSNGEYWYYGEGDVVPPHSHTGKKASDCPDLIPPIGYIPVSTMPMIKVLGSELALSSDQIIFLRDKPDTMNVINAYWEENNRSQNAKDFAKEMIDVIKTDPTVDRNALIFTLSAEAKNKFYTELDDSFLLSMDTYMDMDVANYLATDPGGILWIHFTIECAVLRANHPDWSNAKIYWEASKQFVHVTLDVFGLVPLFGEAADLINGALYTIEGDGVNATLSYASAIPIAGWVTAGTKMGLKVIKTATGKTTLFLKITDGVITFGSRSQLRKILNITASGIQAHHIIPWAKSIHPAIQKAAKSSKFHMNDALNGIPLTTSIHQGSHAHYDNLVEERLQGIIKHYGPNMTPEQAYKGLTDLITDIRTAIQNNPNTPINQLIF